MILIAAHEPAFRAEPLVEYFRIILRNIKRTAKYYESESNLFSYLNFCLLYKLQSFLAI